MLLLCFLCLCGSLRDLSVPLDEHAGAAQTAERRFLGREFFRVDNVGLCDLNRAAHIQIGVELPVTRPRAVT